MEKRRHTDYYIPVLKVLEDLQEHEINSLIAKTADLCNLTEEERQEKTRKGTYYKYESNIQWAIQDLSQGGFIQRTNRGVYTIAFDGLLMLEDNPKHPDRDYLEARSEKFRDFRYRKGSRNNRQDNESETNLFSNLSAEEEEQNISPEKPIAILSDTEISDNANEMLLKCLKVREDMIGLSLDTTQIDTKIKLLKEGIARNAITLEVRQFLNSLLNKKLGQINLLIEIDNNSGKAYVLSDDQVAESLRDSATMLCQCDGINTLPKSESTPPKTSRPQNEEPRPIRKRSKNKEKKQPPKRLRVSFSDGTVLEGKAAADVFAQAIEKCNPERVAQLELTTNGFPLVGKIPPAKYQYKEIRGGFFVPVNSPTEIKRKFLEKIASRLSIAMQVTVE